MSAELKLDKLKRYVFGTCLKIDRGKERNPIPYGYNEDYCCIAPYYFGFKLPIDENPFDLKNTRYFKYLSNYQTFFELDNGYRELFDTGMCAYYKKGKPSARIYKDNTGAETLVSTEYIDLFVIDFRLYQKNNEVVKIVSGNEVKGFILPLRIPKNDGNVK